MQTQTVGGFVQHTWDISSHLSLESGFRGDYESDYGFFPLPRISAMIKPNNYWTVRLGGAMRYNLPSIFVAEAEF